MNVRPKEDHSKTSKGRADGNRRDPKNPCLHALPLENRREIRPKGLLQCFIITICARREANSLGMA
jgi:hypothetical protein